jgi:hypothetical protein
VRHTVHVVSDEAYLLRRELLPRTHVHPTSGGCDGHLRTLHRKGQRTGTVARVETETCERNTERVASAAREWLQCPLVSAPRR